MACASSWPLAPPNDTATSPPSCAQRGDLVRICLVELGRRDVVASCSRPRPGWFCESADDEGQGEVLDALRLRRRDEVVGRIERHIDIGGEHLGRPADAVAGGWAVTVTRDGPGGGAAVAVGDRVRERVGAGVARRGV